MMKNIFLCCLVAVIAFTLPSCKVDNAETIDAFYSRLGEDSYEQGIHSRLKARFARKDIRYRFHDAKGVASAQTEQIASSIEEGTSLLVVDMHEGASGGDVELVLKRAGNADVPVVFFDNAIDPSLLESYNRSVYIGADVSGAGKELGAMIGEYLLDNYELTDTNSDGIVSCAMVWSTEDDMADRSMVVYAIEEADRLLSKGGKPAIELCNTDFDGVESMSAYDCMTHILKDYAPGTASMPELVIADSHINALEALDALGKVGYNTDRSKSVLPIFTVGISPALQYAIYKGNVTGTICLDTEHCADIMERVCRNMLLRRDKYYGVDKSLVQGKSVITIPYMRYYGKKNI